MNADEAVYEDTSGSFWEVICMLDFYKPIWLVKGENNFYRTIWMQGLLFVVIRDIVGKWLVCS